MKKPTFREIEKITGISRSLAHRFLTTPEKDNVIQYYVVRDLGRFFKIKNPTPEKIREKWNSLIR